MIRNRMVTAVAAAAMLGGCGYFHKFMLAPDCHVAQAYQRARQVEPLRVPAGLDAPNVQSALVIPTVEGAPPIPAAKDVCLDQPPRYKVAAPAVKPAGG